MITHATTPTDVVQLADLADGTTVAACGDCHSLIEVTKDDDGYWVACDCDAGYIDDKFQGPRINRKTIRAIVMW